MRSIEHQVRDDALDTCYDFLSAAPTSRTGDGGTLANGACDTFRPDMLPRKKAAGMIRTDLPRAFTVAVRRIVLGGIVLSLSACATTGPDYDPYESMNRGVYAFNEALDEAAIKPAATLYEAITPEFVSLAVSNFFGNLRDIQSALNDLLQGKVPTALEGAMRVTVNSTLGLAGLIDVGTDMGLERRVEDFGQTMGVWGAGSGPYLVLPLLGPSSVRDAFGIAVDMLTDPLLLYTRDTLEYSAAALRLVDDRAQLLPTDLILGTAAIDEYSYVRDAYLQRRQAQVHDGQVPEGEADSPEGE